MRHNECDLFRRRHKNIRAAGAAAKTVRTESFDGELPPKQLKMVQAWIEIHKEELMVDWELAVNGEDPFRIAPLQ